jgi:hypothetical protein
LGSSQAAKWPPLSTSLKYVTAPLSQGLAALWVDDATKPALLVCPSRPLKSLVYALACFRDPVVAVERAPPSR